MPVSKDLRKIFVLFCFTQALYPLKFFVIDYKAFSLHLSLL